MECVTGGLRRHSGILRNARSRRRSQPPNHSEAKEWLDEYDPKVIDELPIKYALSRIANRRNAAKARLANNKQPPSATE
jgi:hypothetical protein